jgi:urease accessory protein
MKAIIKTFPLLLLLAAPAALAHPGHEQTGAIAGLLHPLKGVDHLLAMLAVGLWAARSGGRAAWLLPISFLLAMGVGGALGMAALGLPVAELGIASSVLVFGLLLALSPRLPLAVGVALTGGFALFHGYAHGSEMAPTASAVAYSAGFLLATAALHGVGYLSAQLMRPWQLLQTGGAVIAAVGGTLLAGLV